MDPVVTDALAVYLVVEAGVVFGAVHQAHNAAHDLLEEIFLLDVRHLAHLGHGVEEGFQPVGGVEKGRLVHIVPEALNAEVRQHFVPPAEPLPHFRAEEIGKIRLAGPDRGHKGGAVGLFAEVILGKALLAGLVLFVDAHARVNDGHQTDALGLEVVGELFQVGEALFVHGKIGVALHVVDVHADHVQRQVVGLVLLCHRADVGFGLVAEAALGQTKGPFRRDVAAADEGAELPAQGVLVPAGKQIQLIVRLLGADGQGVVPGVADVIMDFSGEIYKEAKALRSIADQQKIVRTIVGKLVLGVAGLVGVVGDVMPAALVQPAGHFAQAVNDAVLLHLVLPAAGQGGQKRNGILTERERLHDALGGDGVPE